MVGKAYHGKVGKVYSPEAENTAADTGLRFFPTVRDSNLLLIFDHMRTEAETLAINSPSLSYVTEEETGAEK